MQARSARRDHGFTLLELVVAIAIAAILATLAVAGYGDVLREARRLDGRASLFALAAAQERHRLEHGRYATRLDSDPATAVGVPVTERLAFPGYSAQRHYRLALDGGAGPMPAADAWRAVAVPVGSQRRDDACATLELEHTGLRRARDRLGADATSICWR